MAVKSSSKIKLLFKKSGKGLTLKQFARDLVAEGDQTAKDWFANKAGEAINAQKEERKKVKGPLLTIISQATKATRRKIKA
jgi:hypothetical protein